MAADFELSPVLKPDLPAMDADVLLFHPDIAGDGLTNRYHSVVGQFRNLFRYCLGPDWNQNRHTPQLEINLTNKTSTTPRTSAVVRTANHFWHSVSFQQSRGFSVSFYTHDDHHPTKRHHYENYSLGHHDAQSNERIYCKGSWTPDRLNSVAQWLKEAEERTPNTIGTLLVAAADPELNPVLAVRIADAQKRVIRLPAGS
jgi:hypothetical protein